ncbi:transposase family protein [Nonomuraea sp. NPDC004297]
MAQLLESRDYVTHRAWLRPFRHDLDHHYLIIRSDRRGIIVPLALSNDQATFPPTLFPQLNTLLVQHLEDQGEGAQIVARTRADRAERHGCGRASSRVHDRYRRRLHDLACSGRPVLIELEVRRFICGNTECLVATFAEQPGRLDHRRPRRRPPCPSLPLPRARTGL